MARKDETVHSEAGPVGGSFVRGKVDGR
jgi:hypothetical protein